MPQYVSLLDGGRDDPSVRAVLRDAQGRGARVSPPPRRARSCRRPVPGDVPPRAPRVREARARRASARLGAHDRRPHAHRCDTEGEAHGGARRGAVRRGRTSGVRGARAANRPVAAEGARRRRAPVRLRARLRRHRRRPRLDRGSGTAGCLRGSAEDSPPEGGRMTTVPAALDERFRAAAAASGDLDVAFDILDDTPIGSLLVGVSDRGLCRVHFDPDPELALDDLAHRFGPRVLRSPRAIDRAKLELDEYLSGRRHGFDLELDLRGTPDFHQRVLAELAEVPYGTTT